jgi:hypothetical protein
MPDANVSIPGIVYGQGIPAEDVPKCPSWARHLERYYAVYIEAVTRYTGRIVFI